MNFLNRLKFYLIGVGLGILVVLAIFKDRSLTSWTPKNQVLKEIAEGDVIIDDLVLCCINHYGIESKKDIDSLFANANVDFKNSDVTDHERRKYKLYFEEFPISSVSVIITEGNVYVDKMSAEENDCPCK